MDNLACAARADTATLAELVKSNSALTAANAQLATEVKSLGQVNRHIHRLLREANKKAGFKAPASLDEMEQNPPTRNDNRQKHRKQRDGKAADA